MSFSAPSAVFSIRGMERSGIPRIEKTARGAEKNIQGSKKNGWFYRRGLNSYFYSSVTKNEFDHIAGVFFCALKS
jgi:hypothetical protein